MQIPLQITYRGIERSPALDAAVQEKAAKLDQVYRGLISCRVVIDQPGRHKHQGKEFSVHVDLKAPGAEIAVTRDHGEDPFVALRDAFDAAKRKLEDYARKQHGEVKHHAPRGGGR